MTNIRDYDVSRPHTAVVKESSRLTPEGADEVRTLVLNVADPAFRCEPGQSLGVLVQGPHAFGNAQHLRLYSVAGTRPIPAGEGVDLELCVRRCFYIDEVSGERYPGVASHFLCDAQPGDAVTLTGPYGSHFRMPMDNRSNLLMIGTGTGIAPFRAFLKQIYGRQSEWKGKVRLFYGARTGMEVLYRNDQNDDLANYYDEATFKAFEGLSRRSWNGEGEAIDRTIAENAAEIWELVQDPRTHVYLAGLERISESLNKAMAEAAGSEGRWRWVRQELVEQGRWSELLYV